MGDAHVHGPITPEVLDRIHRALEDEETPAPWIARAFEALSYAQGNAARVEELEATIRAVEDACPVCGGAGWTVDADPLPSGEPGEPRQVACWDAEHAVILAAGLSQAPVETDPTFP